MRKITLYIVDDEPEILRNLEALFKPNKRYKVRCHASAEAVLDDLDRWPPKIVICDYMMPDIDGMELLRELKTHNPSLRSVLLTGTGFGADIIAAMEEGLFNHYYAKPYDAQVLSDTVAGLAREVAKEGEGY
jgi:DNA-binding NtrC family response regulator